jgi:hypothetical protein
LVVLQVVILLSLVMIGVVGAGEGGEFSRVTASGGRDGLVDRVASRLDTFF